MEDTIMKPAIELMTSRAIKARIDAERYKADAERAEVEAANYWDDHRNCNQFAVSLEAAVAALTPNNSPVEA